MSIKNETFSRRRRKNCDCDFCFRDRDSIFFFEIIFNFYDVVLNFFIRRVFFFIKFLFDISVRNSILTNFLNFFII